jgi:hypothetical protein
MIGVVTEHPLKNEIGKLKDAIIFLWVRVQRSVVALPFAALMRYFIFCGTQFPSVAL